MHTRSRPIAMFVLLAVAVALVGLLPVHAAAAEKTVTITDRLEPKELTVAPGTTVVWKNADSDRHRVRTTSGPEEFDGDMDPGETYSFTFSEAGTYQYHDHRNDENSAYAGTVTVQAGADSDGNSGNTSGDNSGDNSGGGASNSSESPTPAPEVRMAGRRFSPSSVTVDPGTTVRWLNDDDDEHTVTAEDGSFDSGTMRAGAEYTHTFDSPGTYRYICIYHSDMQATITVSGSGSEGGGQGSSRQSTQPSESSGQQGESSGQQDQASDQQAAQPSGSGATSVSVVDFAFEPGTTEITTGGTVTWTNEGQAPHTVTGSGFDSGMLGSGETYTRTFDSAGTYEYICTFHPEMVATLVVRDASGEAPRQVAPVPATRGTARNDEAPSTGSQPEPGRQSAAIVDFGFEPETLTVAPGTEVSWRNDGQLPHTVTAEDGSFDSGILQAGDAYSFTFDEEGTYRYVCTLHPNMTGTVEVTAAAADTIDAAAPAQAAGDDKGGTSTSGQKQAAGAPPRAEAVLSGGRPPLSVVIAVMALLTAATVALSRRYGVRLPRP